MSSKARIRQRSQQPAKTAAAVPATGSGTRRRPVAVREMTQAELAVEAWCRFGDDPMQWAFACPNCGDVATAAEFPRDKRSRVGQECLGRYLAAVKPNDEPGAPDETPETGTEQNDDATGPAPAPAVRGCEWTAYEPIPAPWRITMPDGTVYPSFPLAEGLRLLPAPQDPEAAPVAAAAAA
jgi:hypothetical protein